MTIAKAALTILFAVQSLTALPTWADAVRDTSQYNLVNGLGLKGYDPVSYFAEGGSMPSQGQATVALTYQGVTYLFASNENRQEFTNNPSKYEPSYGGWCAYAMASGSKVDIDPMIYTINGNRLHFFVSQRAKRNFDADVSGHESRADGFWKMFSGEDPRL